ncbi:UNVERIFIED_CONTAM: hypothetical protein FKN15_005355 [Acipenser sinensis]
MLRFYSFYKQATCGPCAGPRPGFWDPIGRYKCKSKQELVREYLELEKCLSRLEDENNRLRLRLSKSGDSPRVRELEGELERLRALHTELSTENEGWRRGERGLAGSTAELTP